MPIRDADARWEGSLEQGKGSFCAHSATQKTGRPSRRSVAGGYTLGSRTGEEARGSSPEELLAAAEAACYSMALTAALQRAGTPPRFVDTHASCTFRAELTGGITITRLQLTVRAQVPEADPERFQETVQAVKVNCPVSRALRALDIEVQAELLA